eukprot:4135228-Pleurochrysis_carterae.AAC.2
MIRTLRTVCAAHSRGLACQAAIVRMHRSCRRPFPRPEQPRRPRPRRRRGPHSRAQRPSRSIYTAYFTHLSLIHISEPTRRTPI